MRHVHADDQRRVYKAKKARAAAPSRPTAWEPLAAEPGNSEVLGVGAPVGAVPFPEAEGVPLTEEVEVEVAVDVTSTVVE